MIRKQIAVYSNRKQINISKNELTDETEVMLYTLTEHNNISSRLESLSNEVDELKQQIKEKDAIINEHSIDLDKAIEDAVSEKNNKIEQYEDNVMDLNEQINKQNNLIKQYQDTVSDKDNTISELRTALNNEVTGYKLQLSDMISLNNQLLTKYNSLRTSVSTLSRIDVLLNRQKDILTQYPKLHDSVDELIDTRTSDNE